MGKEVAIQKKGKGKGGCQEREGSRRSGVVCNLSDTGVQNESCPSAVTEGERLRVSGRDYVCYFPKTTEVKYTESS